MYGRERGCSNWLKYAGLWTRPPSSMSLFAIWVGWKLLRHGQKFALYTLGFINTRRIYDRPNDYGLKYHCLGLTTADEVHLGCFFAKYAAQDASRIELHERAYKTDLGIPVPNFDVEPVVANVIVFHGSTTSIDTQPYIDMARKLIRRRCNVLLLSYRGFGTSSGTPSESGLQLDAQAALDYITNNPSLSALPTFLYGFCLGGAVAIDLAARNPTAISGVVVQNTFLSVPSLVRDWRYIGWLAKHLVTQRWDSATKVPSIPATVPMLFLSGANDELVSKKHMEGLWDIRKGATPSELDRFESFAGGTHLYTELCPGFWDKIDSWINAVLPVSNTTRVTAL
ncbi:Hydrolase-4 domain-containing protein [Mycena indigotica]|uniref:Hydrolase-4 domain-containing protein n=1 Tax=Mycena indigotica TaxID=2126181 RepID=A0A8H6WHT3_9AGAR|nr:Hydrolase-4 domain-containing protein [Mycena indigotica]KAF7312774.1 Hydrolase-4 domain-containing protein [Mycena indigotica]